MSKRVKHKTSMFKTYTFHSSKLDAHAEWNRELCTVEFVHHNSLRNLERLLDRELVHWISFFQYIRREMKRIQGEKK